MAEKTKKKVLLLITKANWGGAQRYVYDIATHLNPELFDITVATGETGELTTVLAHQRVNTIQLTSLSNTLSPKQSLQAALEIWRLLRTTKPDVLHVNSSVAGAIGVFIGRIAGVPRILFTAHGWAFNEDRPRWQQILFKIVHWFTVLLSHRTIAVSHAVMKQLSLPGTKNKMKVLHPGRTLGVVFNHDEAREILIQEHQPLSSHSKDIWIGNIAELHKTKQHNFLIEAFSILNKSHPNLRLVIIGEGSERSELTSQIEKQQLKDSVFLVGAIHEAARLLKAFDAFVLTSRSEAYGYVLHEAGLAKVPTVATRVGGTPEVITDGVSGLLVGNNDIPELVGALSKILDDQKYAKTLAERHYEEMSSRTLAKMTLATEALYTLS